MDPLLQKATNLAKQGSTPYRPIPGRVAYVVSHGQSYASNGYAVRTQGIAKALNEHGLETLCFVRQGRPWDLGVSGESITPEMNIDGVRYIHTRWPNNKKPKTNEEKLLAGADALEQLFRIYRPSAVLAGSNFLAGLPAWVAAQRLGVPFHNEVRGFWELSQAAREDGFETTDRFREDAERDTFVAQQAGSVFTLNEPMKQELIKRGVSEKNILIVPNGIDKLPEPKQPSSTQQNELGIKPGEKVVAYIGSHNEYEGLELLFDACESLVNAGQPIKLLMVGDKQPLTHPTKKSINSQNAPWLIQTGRIPHEQMADYYALADVVVIPRKSLPVCQLVPPIKVVEALSYRKPLVLSDIAPLKPYTEAFPAATSFQAGSSTALATAIQTALTQSEQSEGDIESLRFNHSVTPMVEAFTGKVSGSGAESPLLNSSNEMTLSSEPTWQETSVVPGQPVTITAAVEYHNVKGATDRKAVLLIKSYDSSGQEVAKPCGKLAKSGHLRAHFKYLPCTKRTVENVHQFTVPQGVAKLKVGICGFNQTDEETVTVTGLRVQPGVAPLVDEEPTLTDITREPLWFDFPVDELVPHTISGKFAFEERADISMRACIARIEYQDADGNTIPGPYNGLAKSKLVGTFSYLNVTSEKLLQIVPPMGAKRVSLGVQSWNAQNAVQLVKPVQCTSQLAPAANESEHSKSAHDAALAAKRSEAPARALKDVKVAAILDEFTMECFRHEVQLTALTPKNWEAELEASQPDMLFVESCWFGNGNQWSGLIYGYTSNGPNKMDDLIKVIAHCRKKGIPTVFWAKEDPVHYKRFGPTAKLFDYVYTTDANIMKAYKADFGIDAEPLSFFCQPRVHNPSPIIARNEKAAFAGSYYSDKIERCENFHTIMQGLEQARVDYDIYDRCLKRGVEHLQFPEHFKQHVVGYLEPHEMWKAYKGYRYTVNLNTVKHSPTMFARRVYESLASGTPVISNYSEGVITQFSGIVCASDNQQDVVEYLNRLRDPEEYRAISEQGVRETLGHHTLADRLEQVCERLGIPVIPHLPVANAIYTAGTEAEVERARAHFQEQGYHHKRLVVNLENSNVLYPYLNQNNEEEIFRVLTEFAKPLQGIDVSMTPDNQYLPTFLEDEAIKTQYQADAEPAQIREAVV